VSFFANQRGENHSRETGAEDRPDLKYGTYHVYWYCRCDPRKAANARKSAALRARKLAMGPEGPSLPLLLAVLWQPCLLALGARLELATYRLTAGGSAD
jgi:hypothetical protein